MKELVDHSWRKQMYISTIYDAYIAILDYKFIKHLCPILQGTFFFFFWFFLVQNTFKKKKTIMPSFKFYSNFCISTAKCKKEKKKKEKKLPKSGFYARHFNSKMLVQENVALKIIV